MVEVVQYSFERGGVVREGKNMCCPMNKPMADKRYSTKSTAKEKKWHQFRRFWVKEPRQSGNASAKKSCTNTSIQQL